MTVQVSKSTISHSEVDQFLACERRHYYGFGIPNSEGGQGLEPKFLSDGLYRGTVGHGALEEYYKHLAPISINGVPDDEDFDEAVDLAMNSVMAVIAALPDDEYRQSRSDMLLNLMVVLNKYFEYYREEDKNYQFLAVETEFRTVVSDEIDFPFKPDLIRRHRHTGRVEVVDHKFLANLYTSQEIAIQPQLAKYTGSLRNLGYEVDDAVYDLICHRVLKTKPYDASTSCKRLSLGLTQSRIARSMKEQDAVVATIAKYKDGTVEDWEANVKRSANSYNCKHCSFLGICISELNGEDISVPVHYNFNANTYGYDKNRDAV